MCFWRLTQVTGRDSLGTCSMFCSTTPRVRLRWFDHDAANGRNRRILLGAVRSGEGPLTEHITATQAQPPERVFMPLFGHWRVSATY